MFNWPYEKCSKCFRNQRIAWALKDEVWNKVTETDTKTWCLECFLEEADKKSIEIKKEDFLYFGWIGLNIKGDDLIDLPI